MRVRATNSESYGAYLKLLKEDPQEYEFLLDALTVNVSEFFRNPETFRIIEKEVIPSLVKNRSGYLSDQFASGVPVVQQGKRPIPLLSCYTGS